MNRQAVTYPNATAVNLAAGQLVASGPDFAIDVVAIGGVTPAQMAAADAVVTAAAATDATTKANNAQAASQPLATNLTAFAALVGAADKMVRFTGIGTMVLDTITTYGRSLAAAVDAAAAKTLLSLAKADVGLANVDNTSDASKPVSTAQAAADALRLLLTGGTLTGILTVQLAEAIANMDSTTASNGAYFILKSNGTNIGSFQAGGTTMAQPYTDQMRIRAYRAAGGIDLTTGGSSDARGRLDSAGGWMCNGGVRAGKAISTVTAETLSDAFGVSALYGAAQLPGAGAKGTVAVCDTTAQAAGQGGRITFGGAYTGTTVTTAASLGAAKQNSTDGQYGFGVDVWTRPNGGSLTRRLLVEATGGVVVDTSLAIGGGTALTKAVVYIPSLTPASVAANTSAEQTFTVTGLATTDVVSLMNPAQTAGVGIVGVRVSAANTLAICFGNFTAGALTPAAGIHGLIAFRS